MCENSLLPSPLSASCPQDVSRDIMDSQPLTKVLPFLYLGNSKNAEDREGMAGIGITHVLNVTTSQQSPSPILNHRAPTGTAAAAYKRLSVLDNGHANLKQYFEEAFDFIGKSSSVRLSHCILCSYSQRREINLSFYLLKGRSTMPLLGLGVA